jgi:phage FluMu protein Com
MCGLPSHLRDRESGEQEYVRFTIEGTEGIRPLQHYSDASGTGFFVAMVVSNHELNFDADVRAVTGGSILSQAPFTMAIIRRRIRCHYCNMQSRDSVSNVPRQYLCPHCDAVNHFDEVNTQILT